MKETDGLTYRYTGELERMSAVVVIQKSLFRWLGRCGGEQKSITFRKKSL
jgi:hypothetical protein